MVVDGLNSIRQPYIRTNIVNSVLKIYVVNVNDDVLETKEFFVQDKKIILQSILNTVVVRHTTSPRPFSRLKKDVSSRSEKRIT